MAGPLCFFTISPSFPFKFNHPFTKAPKMAQNNFPILFSFVAVLLAPIFSFANGSERKDHIVYMGSIKNRAIAKSTHHLNLLQSVIGTSFDAKSSYIRSYGRSFNGFSAKLTDAETQQLAAMEGVVSVFESKKLKTQTTRSWDYVGFDKNTKRNIASENDVIIGSIDSGIWPESESFNDEGSGAPPPRWKGVCAGGVNFTCNNKVIGARYYSGTSARDNIGHGTHTASTAAGKSVETAGFYGIAGGVARGGVPSSRIAVYKVCDPAGCSEVDILAAFDDAIADGVNIITVSIGGLGAVEFTMDSIAIGSFHALGRGILTVHSAGNDGPMEGSIGSVAPWILTVGATTTDRSIVDKVVLGNGNTLTGYAVNSFSSNNNVSIIYGSNVSKNCSSDESEICMEGCLDQDLVKGNIVLCRTFDGASEAYKSGADGAIVYNSKIANVSFISPFPAVALSWEDFLSVANYSASATNPHVRILKSAAINDPFAPMAAQFSSRGPNPLLPEIMKPDVAAPGVEILAAFSPIVSPSNNLADKRSVDYSVISGTSMSCPHVAGVAAYVKSFHPDWSPAMIKSAVMTTAKPIARTDGSQIGEFLHGSGLINPKEAVEPGLVYEIVEGDYLNLLCGNGFDSKTMGVISGNKSACPRNPRKFPARDLNYPAMVGRVSPMKPFVVKFQRTVTNVGAANSTYRSEILPISEVNVQKSSEKVKVSVEPPELWFGDLNEKKSFVVTVAGLEIPSETVFWSGLVWSDGIRKVRSSIVVKVVEII